MVIKQSRNELYSVKESIHCMLQLRTLGLLCGLMPKDTCKTELIKAIQSGITKHAELGEFSSKEIYVCSTMWPSQLVLKRSPVKTMGRI